MNWLNPAFWNGVGVVSLVVLLGVAIAKGWLVPRSLHNEIVGDMRATIADLRAALRAAEDTARVNAETISKHDGADVAAIRILEATRKAALRGGGEN